MKTVKLYAQALAANVIENRPTIQGHGATIDVFKSINKEGRKSESDSPEELIKRAAHLLALYCKEECPAIILDAEDDGHDIYEIINGAARIIVSQLEDQEEENGAKTFTYPEGTAADYFTKSEYQKPGIYKDPEGYTPNAWVGSNCPKDRFLPIKEVAGYIREYIKSDPELRACKWSVTTESSAGCQSLTVALMAGPFECFSETFKAKKSYDVQHGYSQHGDCKDIASPEAFRVISKVKAFAVSFNYDDSEGTIDYYDRGFYDHYYIGKWNKPYTKTERKEPAPVKKAEPAPAKEAEAQAEPAAPAAGSLRIVDYSEKAIAVVGDTKQIKGILQKLGGRFNSRLTCGAGWVFSKKKADEVRAALAI